MTGTITSTIVGIVGGGPAGLMLSHLREGIAHEGISLRFGGDGSWSICRFEIPEELGPDPVAGRQLGELASVTDSAAGSTYLAEAYTGWPNP